MNARAAVAATALSVALGAGCTFDDQYEIITNGPPHVTIDAPADMTVAETHRGAAGVDTLVQVHVQVDSFHLAEPGTCPRPDHCGHIHAILEKPDSMGPSNCALPNEEYNVMTASTTFDVNLSLCRTVPPDMQTPMPIPVGGAYRLTVRLVDNVHTPLTNPEAVQTINFTVPN